MIKKIAVLYLLTIVVCASAQKGKKVDPTKTSETVAAAPIDSLLGYAMYENMTPFSALDYQLP
jgi:hypothetical protein